LTLRLALGGAGLLIFVPFAWMNLLSANERSAVLAAVPWRESPA
jgi:hypothetical protein